MDQSIFSLNGQVAVLTGGSGVLGTAMARGLLDFGARVCLVGRDLEKAQRAAQELHSDGERAMGLAGDVTQRESVEGLAQEILTRWGKVDILVNAAGGNRPGATVSPGQSFFDLPADALRTTVDLNLIGTIIPSQVFGRAMAEAGAGSIINISSMAAVRPLTRVIGYSAAKAGIDNFTQWLAVHMAREYSPRLRVNALAPGFFLADQNRAMLMDAATGELTPRGKSIVAHTPMGRFGEAPELVGALVWLASPAAQFVTGIVVPIDGGFSAFGGI